jgi:hypothetical protein
MLEPVTSEPAYWTLDETARFLRLSKESVTAWRKSGRIPREAVKRPGLKWLFNSENIRRLMDREQQPAGA